MRFFGRSLILGSAAVLVAGIISGFGVGTRSSEANGSDPNNLFNLRLPLAAKPDLTGFINPDTPDADKWLIVLGKALFWDMQAGSDGQACASCHHAAGTDLRIKNSLNPNFTNQVATMGVDGDGKPIPGDAEFGSDNSYGPNDVLLAGSGANDPDNVGTPEIGPGQIGDPELGTIRNSGPNIELKKGDLPLHKLVNEHDREGPIAITSNDRVSSSGSFANVLVSVTRGGLKDRCKKVKTSIFHTWKGRPARQVEPRNTPTTINALFFPVQFWDGRAKNVFNGFNPTGRSGNVNDPVAGLLALGDNGHAKEDLEKDPNPAFGIGVPVHGAPSERPGNVLSWARIPRTGTQALV